MFVQVIQGSVRDPAEVRAAMEQWMQDLAPGATGWLGSTAGVTEDGRLVAVARFDSEEAARQNVRAGLGNPDKPTGSFLFAGGGRRPPSCSQVSRRSARAPTSTSTSMATPTRPVSCRSSRGAAVTRPDRGS